MTGSASATIQGLLSPLWGYAIEHYEHDLHNHTICMHVRVGADALVALQFLGVLAHKFDLIAYGEVTDDATEPWEVAELSEIHYLPHLKQQKHHDRKLDDEPFHFLCEMFRARLFIRCKAVTINGREHPTSLPPFIDDFHDLVGR